MKVLSKSSRIRIKNSKLQQKAEKDIRKRLADNNIIRILQSAESILTRHDLEIDYPETQAYRRDKTRLNCHRHESIFDKHKIIPKFCFNCYKVQITLGNVLELLKLYFYFNELWVLIDELFKQWVHEFDE